MKEKQKENYKIKKNRHNKRIIMKLKRITMQRKKRTKTIN